MPRKRHKPEEIVTKLRQVDVLVSQGQGIVDAIRQIGVSEVVFVTNCSTARSSTRCVKPSPTSRLARLQAAGTTGLRPGILRVAGCAGARPSVKLTFQLDHSMKADQ